MSGLLLIILLFFAPYQQSLEGTWEGTLTHDVGYAASYRIMIHLVYEDGKYTGRSLVKVQDISAEMLIEGKLIGEDLLILQDTRITNQSILEGMEWCLKKYQLRLGRDTEDQLQLAGTWQGSTSFGLCIPGMLTLRRSKERA